MKRNIQHEVPIKVIWVTDHHYRDHYLRVHQPKLIFPVKDQRRAPQKNKILLEIVAKRM